MSNNYVVFPEKLGDEHLKECAESLIQALEKPEENADLVRLLALSANCDVLGQNEPDEFIEYLKKPHVVRQSAAHLLRCKDCRVLIEMVARPMEEAEYKYGDIILKRGWEVVSMTLSLFKLKTPRFPGLIQPLYDSCCETLKEYEEETGKSYPF